MSYVSLVSGSRPNELSACEILRNHKIKYKSHVISTKSIRIVWYYLLLFLVRLREI